MSSTSGVEAVLSADVIICILYGRSDERVYL